MSLQPNEVFLSHASEDHAVAARIATTLAVHGVPTFSAPQSILGAQQWQDVILEALQRCDWFLVLLSPEAVASMWVKRKVAFALQERRYEDRIVPLRYRETGVGSLQWLTLFQMIDFSGAFDSGCRDLLRTWGMELRLDSVAPV